MASIAAPCRVEVVPSDFFDEQKDRINLVVSVLTLFFTAAIPFFLWLNGRTQEQRQRQQAAQQEKHQRQQAAQQRLQEQLMTIGDAAMGVISGFKDDCEELLVSYTDVFKRRRLVAGPEAAITRQQLQEVEHARRQLQPADLRASGTMSWTTSMRTCWEIPLGTVGKVARCLGV
jgi:hypothetical protein